jgi:antitoxin component of MazEF toxin-antitoxin module
MRTRDIIQRRLTFTGGSFVFRIPKGYLDTLGIAEGDHVAIECEGECIKITKAESQDLRTMTKLASIRQRHDFILNLSATASVQRSTAIQASQQEPHGSLVQRAFGLMLDGAFFATQQEVSAIMKWIDDHNLVSRPNGHTDILVCRSVVAQALKKRLDENRDQGLVSLRRFDLYDLMALRRSVWRSSIPELTDMEADALMEAADQGTDAFLQALLKQFEVAVRVCDDARPLVA